MAMYGLLRFVRVLRVLAVLACTVGEMFGKSWRAGAGKSGSCWLWLCALRLGMARRVRFGTSGHVDVSSG